MLYLKESWKYGQDPRMNVECVITMKEFDIL